ncbi:SDR family NAD(P)-dependent oxidoreductase [Saccharibacillus sp. JS10]|uniref:SDR family NAD(P)-dependent oxidoreductase n=1 Tax=Saccharibacillus sp. JS10 TaxID=2950552 RepID=UPI00210DBB94|nr:SDR family NAD(P)-dependent oxidoreductase [Saccharibacillus sp. JS10]MCQ4088620.1 SDR family NAD(P)-dependent oxidoreductase [Saccharibacillus sp. JS10]
MSSKVAIVTGTSSGFGLHICIGLAQAGVQVIAAMRQPENADQLIQQVINADRQSGQSEAADSAKFMEEWEPLGIGQISKHIYPVKLDVRDDIRVREVVQEIAERFGHIDILVNNAGMAIGGFVDEVPIEAWQKQFAVNVFGLISMTSAVVPYMREARSGCIIQMSSVSGVMGLPGYGPYVSSKFAVEGFSESLALETAAYGIRTYLVEPASYRTEIWEKGFANIYRTPRSPNEKMLDRMLDMSRQSAKNGGNPQDVAQLAVDLALGKKGRGRFRYVLPRKASWMIAMKKRAPFRVVQYVMLSILRREMKP